MRSEKIEPIKMHRKPKTERRYERVNDVVDFCRVIEKHGDRIAYSYFDKERKVQDLTYSKLNAKILRIAAGLTEAGLAKKKIAVIGPSSVEWVASYIAILATGGIAIPMDRELEIGVIGEFLASVDADAIVYAGSFNGKFDAFMTEHKSLTKFIAIDPDEAEEQKEKVISLAKIIENGKLAVRRGYRFPKVENRDSLAEFLFTSGTTGSSKCVMLSQNNIFSVVNSAAETVDFTPDDKIVSVLPLHHTYELAVMLAALVYGMHVCINDSLTHVLKNFKIFQPTGLVLVPLFIYTIYKKIWAEAKKTGRDKILKVGIGASKALKSVGVDSRRAIFKDVHESFGGKLEKIICGGAALNPKMIEFFENIGISIYEGFGITECSPLVSVTPYYARKYGSVGPCVPCCQARVEGTETNARGFIEGEIQVKGDNVMLGYYNNDEANEAAFTDDGWFRTGDMGYIDEDGYIYITGRLKTVIVLENGKNIFPEEIEEYLAIDKIAECVVVGRQSGEVVNLVALIYPNFTQYPENTPIETIQEDIQKEINKINKNLPSHKQVKQIEIRETEFEKTTSKKIKRHLVK